MASNNRKSLWSKKASQIENLGGLYTTKSFSKFGKLMFWRNKVIISNKAATVKKINWVYIIFGSLFFSFFIYGLTTITPGFAKPNGSNVVMESLANMLKFDSTNDLYYNGNLWMHGLRLLLITIQVTIIGTLMGAILALFTSFLSARNMTPWFINQPIRAILAFFRTLPPLVYALIFAAGFKPALASTLTLMFFTWSVMNKLLYEEIENTSLSSYEALISAGSTKFSAFRSTVLQKILPKYISLGLYSFEINLRISTILGFIGGGLAGIGGMMGKFIATNDFNNLGIPLVILVASIIAIESISTLLRVFVFEANLNKLNADSIDRYTSEKQYYINCLKHKFKNKIERAKSKQKIQKLQSTLDKKIKNIESKYKKINSKITNQIKDSELKQLKLEYTEKENKILSYYNRRIASAKSKNKLKVANKLTIALKQNIFDLKIKLQQRQALVLNAIGSSQKVLFVHKKSPKDFIVKSIFGIALFALTIWSISIVKWGMLPNSTFGLGLRKIVHPNTSLFGQALFETVEATTIAFISTIIGGALAFVTGMLASRKVTPFFISPIFSLLIIVIRVIPAFVVALILVPGLIDSQFAAVLALSIHSVGMLGKLTREQFNAIELGPQQSISAAGGNRIEQIRYGVFPQVIPNVTSVIIYRFEINIKSMTEVGFVYSGISNMGWNLKQYLNDAQDGSKVGSYEKAYSYIWSIVLVILVVEFFSNIIRNYILTGLLPKWLYTIKRILNRKKIIRNSIILNNLNYNVEDLTGDQINSLANSEKQSKLDEGITDMFLSLTSFKKLIKVNEKLFVLENKRQFSGDNSLELKQEIKNLKIQKRTLLKDISEFRKSNISKINKLEKTNVRKGLEYKKDIHNKYKKVYSKYRKNILKTKKEALQFIQESKNKLKNANQNGTSAEVYKRRLELKTAKKIKTKLIKLAKAKPIHNFF